MNKDFETSSKIVLNALNINDVSDIKKVYHYLAKNIHPDNVNGDETYFKNLQTLYNFYIEYINRLNNIEEAKGNFDESLNFLLKRFGADINDLEAKKLIYDSLNEYAKDTKNDAFLNRQNKKDNKEFTEYQTSVKDFVNYYKPNNIINKLKGADNLANQMTKQCMLQINLLISKTNLEIDKFNNQKELDEYMRTSFIKNYKLLVLSYIQKYLSHYNKIDIKYINESCDKLDKHIKSMTLEKVYDNLNDYLSITLPQQEDIDNKNKIKEEQDKKISEVKKEMKQQVNAMRNKTKGILNHLYKNNYINSTDFTKYYLRFKQGRAIEDYKEIYQELYVKYYYDNEIAKIKNHTINSFYSFTRNNPNINSLTYVNTLKRILDDIESYPNKIDSTKLRELDKLDFNDLDNINKVLSSLEETRTR